MFISYGRLLLLAGVNNTKILNCILKYITQFDENDLPSMLAQYDHTNEH
jgi:hypothetical protein